ncbi:alpha/beta hydrolase [Granulicella rosea]|nr:alpha/beta hydrolase-fold protein [Granulicella rosea]
MLKFRLHSAILPDDRDVSIYLPPQYALEPGRRFPVLYLHDGQNLFDPETSYIPGHTWRAHTAADRLAEAGLIEPVILVGVDNTGVRRMAEYTPTEDYKMGGGDGDRYGRLLVEELKPWVDRTLRTRADADSTGIGGSSLGGLISLHLALRHPEIFGRAAIISPSIWWDQRSILSEVRQLKKRPNLRLWLDIGTAEGARHVRDTALLHRLLVGLGWRDEVDLAYRTIPDGVHSEDAWADRFDSVLLFLYPAKSVFEHR